MGYEAALEKALESFSMLSPYVVASKSGTVFDRDRFTIKFFNRVFFVSHPDGFVVEDSSEAAIPEWLRVLLLHYLIQSEGIPVADDWIVYRQLPGTSLFEQRFRNMAINPLTKVFGNDLEGFRRAGDGLGGMPMDRTGDAAFRFLALPRIPLACILYLGDDEVSPVVNVLFDASAPAYLPTEDLSLLGAYLNNMRKYRG